MITRSGQAHLFVYRLRKKAAQAILILVHPDAIFEKHGGIYSEEDQGFADQEFQNLKNYVEAVSTSVESGTFDKIFTLLMYSDSYEPRRKGEQTLALYHWFRDYLFNSTNAMYDAMTLGKNAFSNEIGSYIIDHPEAEIYFSGGYRNLCVAGAVENFCEILKGISDKEPIMYDELMFTRE